MLEHNEKQLLLADHQGLLSTTVIQELSRKLTRRSKAIARVVNAEDLDLEQITLAALDHLRTVPFFAEPEVAEPLLKSAVSAWLPGLIEHALFCYNGPTSPRSTPVGSPAGRLYRELVRGQRGPIYKDAAAILAAELTNRNLYLVHPKDRLTSLDLSHFCFGIYEAVTVTTDSERRFWEQTPAADQRSQALSILPAVRPLGEYLAGQIRAASLNIPVN